MAQNTFALMTNLGRAKEAAAIANGTAVVITHIAIGDGATVPSGGETALYNEIARKAISGHGTVVGATNVAYFDIFLKAAEGPYTIREAGLIDQDGDLIAIARYDPPISKPIPSSGQTVEGTIRLEVAFSNIANITIVVDPAFKVELQRLSRLPWISVISMSVTAPPASPAIGDAYLIPTGATGSWVGQSGKIAEYSAAGWNIIDPPAGHGISLPDGRVFECISGAYIEKIALDVQSGKWNFAPASGAANALNVTLPLVPTSYGSLKTISVLPSLTNNAGPVTINVNGLGAIPVSLRGSQSIPQGAIKEGVPCSFIIADNIAHLAVSFGTLVGMQVFKDPGTFTYTPSPGTAFIIVEGCGGGGGGGGSQIAGAGNTSAGGGGSCGSWGKKLITGPIDPYTVIIGAAGIGVGGDDGVTGGTTSFGSSMTLPGGRGGAKGIISSVPSSSGLSFKSDDPTGVDFGAAGSGLYAGFAFSGSGIAGAGGSGPYGIGGVAYGFNGTVASSGTVGTGYGAGGGGGLGVNSGIVTAGGNGTSGILIIHEYAGA